MEIVHHTSATLVHYCVSRNGKLFELIFKFSKTFHYVIMYIMYVNRLKPFNSSIGHIMIQISMKYYIKYILKYLK